MSQSQKEYEEKKHLPKEIKVRLVKVRLDERRSEILLTNIFDKTVTNSDFKELYSKRVERGDVLRLSKELLSGRKVQQHEQ